MRQFLRDIISIISGFRKFTVMMVLIIIGVVFRVYGLISGQEMVSLLQGTAVAYMAGNGLEHMTNAVKEWIKSKRETSKDA